MIKSLSVLLLISLILRAHSASTISNSKAVALPNGTVMSVINAQADIVGDKDIVYFAFTNIYGNISFDNIKYNFKVVPAYTWSSADVITSSKNLCCCPGGCITNDDSCKNSLSPFDEYALFYSTNDGPGCTFPGASLSCNAFYPTKKEYFLVLEDFKVILESIQFTSQYGSHEIFPTGSIDIGPFKATLNSAVSQGRELSLYRALVYPNGTVIMIDRDLVNNVDQSDINKIAWYHGKDTWLGFNQTYGFPGYQIDCTSDSWSENPVPAEVVSYENDLRRDIATLGKSFNTPGPWTIVDMHGQIYLIPDQMPQNGIVVKNLLNGKQVSITHNLDGGNDIPISVNLDDLPLLVESEKGHLYIDTNREVHLFYWDDNHIVMPVKGEQFSIDLFSETFLPMTVLSTITPNISNCWQDSVRNKVTCSIRSLDLSGNCLFSTNTGANSVISLTPEPQNYSLVGDALSVTVKCNQNTKHLSLSSRTILGKTESTSTEDKFVYLSGFQQTSTNGALPNSSPPTDEKKTSIEVKILIGYFVVNILIVVYMTVRKKEFAVPNSPETNKAKAIFFYLFCGSMVLVYNFIKAQWEIMKQAKKPPGAGAGASNQLIQDKPITNEQTQQSAVLTITEKKDSQEPLLNQEIKTDQTNATKEGKKNGVLQFHERENQAMIIFPQSTN